MNTRLHKIITTLTDKTEKGMQYWEKTSLDSQYITYIPSGSLVIDKACLDLEDVDCIISIRNSEDEKSAKFHFKNTDNEYHIVDQFYNSVQNYIFRKEESNESTSDVLENVRLPE